MISHCNGPLEFELPDDWTAEPDKEWGFIYYRKGDDDSALRVNVIIGKKSDATASEFYKTITDEQNKHPNSQLTYSNQRPILFHEKELIEDGCELKQYFWQTGNFIPPNCGQMATFSYTILRHRESDLQNIADIEALSKAVKSLKFVGARPL